MRRFILIIFIVCFGFIMVSSEASFTLKTDVIEEKFSEFTISVDGEIRNLEADPLVYKDSIYLPLRITASLLGKNVNYIDDTRTVEISSSMVKSKWKDKKIVTFGDSITWYDGNYFFPTHIDRGELVIGYQSYMRDELQAIVDNQGISGADMPRILNEIKPYNFESVDAVTITSGANDHRKNTPLGEIQEVKSKFDETTFTGSLQAAIESILLEKPSIKIYLLTPIKGWFNEIETASVPGPYKKEMLISEDYVNAIKDVGRLYSLPVLDLYNFSGINEITKEVFIGDDPDVFTSYELHPTNEGYERIADIIVPFLKNN